MEGVAAVGSIGVAAHIKAAAPRGKRYDPNMTPEQRQHFDNGIWLCQTDSRLIDTDEVQFPVGLLHGWKELAEERAFQEYTSGHLATVPAVAETADTNAIFKKVLEAAKSDSNTFRRSAVWPVHPVSLRLVLKNGDRNQDLTASDLAARMNVFDELAIVASPGTGKTTTLLQVVESALTSDNFVAIYVPLSEWPSQTIGLFASILTRPAFRGCQESDLILLAENGRLAFAFDAWNELDNEFKKNVRNEINKIKRNFPDLRIVISSRSGDTDLPIGGPVVALGLLTEDQQIEIAKSIRPDDGEKIIDHARRTSGLRDLIEIPLYLTALLQYKGGDPLPKTKEQILRLFVESAENEPAKRTILREELQGFHRDYVEAIAVEATRLKTTVLSEAQIRAVVNIVQAGLKQANQIAELLSPVKIVDALVNSHLIVRSSAGLFSCQHQQFQEWFASLYVERLMISQGRSDADRKVLREEVLDIPFWEEAVLFSCERVSNADENGAKLVASVIIDTMVIDPLFSAEMIWRSSETAWQISKDYIVAFVKKWHSAGKVDRAFRFMILSGRPEFSEPVWPLVSDKNEQVHLHALRSIYPFRPSVLGLDISKKFSELKEDIRGSVIAEMASNGSTDGIELATALAIADSSAEVKASAVQALVFRKANRAIFQILKDAPDEVYQELAKSWYPGDFADAAIEAKIEKESNKIQDEGADPLIGLRSILRVNIRDDSKQAKVKELIERADLKKDAEHLIHQLHQLYPDAVEAGLICKLKKGEEVPYLTYELLKDSSITTDDGEVLDQLIKNENEVIAAVAGPVGASMLIDQYLHTRRKIAANGRFDEALDDQQQSLVQRISRTKPDSFAAALLKFVDVQDAADIASLADLVHRFGYRAEREPIIFSEQNQNEMVKLIGTWGSRLLASTKATRAEMAIIAMAAERLASPELSPILRSLLLEDIRRYKIAKEEFQKARKQGTHYDGDGHNSWTEQYKRAFIAIKGETTVAAMKDLLHEPEFCKEAAIVLKMIWKSTEPSTEPSNGFSTSPEFSRVPNAFIRRQNQEEPHAYAVEILNVVKSLIKEGSTAENHNQALQLGTVVVTMPSDGEENLISELIKLPQPNIVKCDFLTMVALSGRQLSSEVVMAGTEELLTEAKRNTWLMDHEGARFKDWLRLFAFTEKPTAMLPVLEKTEGFDKSPWNLRGIFHALTYSPSPEADKVLSELALRDPRMVCEYDWSIALLRRGTLSAARVFLNHLCNNFNCTRGTDSLYMTLSTMMANHSDFAAEVYAQYEKLPQGDSKSLLLSSIAHEASIKAVLFLIRAATAHKIQFSTIGWAIQECVTGRRAGRGFAERNQIGQLRKEIFAMVVGAISEESDMACKGLILLDETLDEYGDLEVEVRHPDISLGKPWPQVDKILKK